MINFVFYNGNLKIIPDEVRTPKEILINQKETRNKVRCGKVVTGCHTPAIFDRNLQRTR